MAITILHKRSDLPATQLLKLSMPLDIDEDYIDAVRSALDAGGYVPVAEVDTDDLEEAYRLTQNGVASGSWSLVPPSGVNPVGKAYKLIDGDMMGHKSSAVGDVFIKEDRAYVVGLIGFQEVTGWEPPQPEQQPKPF